LSTNFSRSLIGGDIGGLSALASRLQSYPAQIGNVVGALNHQVERLVHDAGWWGDAADSFKHRWEMDSGGAQALGDVVTIVAQVIDSLATNLRNVEDALQQAVGDARAAGVPVGQDGRPPSLPVGATPAVQAAAATYEQEWQLAQDIATRARMDANRQLMDIESQIGPQAAGSGQLSAFDWVTDADYLRGFWAVPAAARLYAGGRIPLLRAERDAAKARFQAAVKRNSRLHIKTADDIKAARRATAAKFAKATDDLARTEALVKKVPLATVLDYRVASAVVKLAPGLAEESRMMKFLGEIPVIDVGAAVAGTALQSYDDMQKGDDWTAIPKEFTANAGGIIAGVAVGAVVVGGLVAIGVGSPVILIGAAAIVGGAVAVGVGDAITNVWHEHWDEDIHKYGVVGGIGTGLANVGTNTGHDLVKLGSNTVNAVGGAATSLWHGIFG
jgi:uncharacterized protein YukE